MARSFVRRMPSLVTLAVPLAATALVAAACGSGGGSSSTTATTAVTTAVTTAAVVAPAGTPAAGSVVVTTASGSAGTYLTDGAGRALYLWVADSNGRSACTGACAGAWPPLTTKATATAAGGVEGDDLGTIVRADGSRQVTYYGHPLYYFVGDMAAGQTNGQGSDGFGAKWWLVAPSGAAITATASAGPSTGSASGRSWG
jgi:predicted lipoprotein with Yx(FWY)xxD motif